MRVILELCIDESLELFCVFGEGHSKGWTFLVEAMHRFSPMLLIHLVKVFSSSGLCDVLIIPFLVSY